jgi:NADP-dependent aldehyde dehydrogenase
MSLNPVLIAGEWQDAKKPVDEFMALNPATKSPLPDRFPVSGIDDVELAMQAAQDAVEALHSIGPKTIAHFLDLYAERIETYADALVEMANLETGLPSEPRLGSVELPRTTNQLRQAATAVRERSWCMATIDTQTNIR